MQKIIPHLWFDSQAEEAAKFYVDAFASAGAKDSKVGSVVRYTKAGFEIHGQPEGKVMTAEFSLGGFAFIALNGGPVFTFNPAVSFMVNFDPSRDPHAREHLDGLWAKLSPGGKALMPLDAYPFSERFGWIQDRFGVSWQLILTKPEGEERPFIIPSLLFVGPVCGKADEAIDFYVSVFKNAKRGMTARYGKGQDPEKEGTLMFAEFMAEGQWFTAMDSAREHGFAFNEAISFLVNVADQNENDYYWDKLTAGGDPKAQQCGWLKDRFGVSWQIAPTILSAMMNDPDKAKVERVTNAFMPMKKLDIAALKRAYEGK